MLIKKEPVSRIKVDKEGHIVEIEHYSDGKKKSCIYCKTLTKEREFGSAVCKDCAEYGYEKCLECKYGSKVQTFHCNGNDLEDHFESYIACAMIDHMGKFRDKPNFEEDASSWIVSPVKRKKCFTEKGA